MEGETPTFRGHTVMVEGLKLHCRIGGTGPHLLMLHGFTLTGEQWLPLAGDFTSGHTVVIVDLPGHGGSEPMPGAYNFAVTARLMHGLLDELGAETACGIGHSAGAFVLLNMAERQPERMSAMVLIGGAHFIGQEARKVMRQERFEQLGPAEREFYRRLHPGGLEQVERIFRQYNGLADNRESISTGALGALPVRTLLVWGDRDRYFPLEVALEMYRALPRSALWVVPGQGHTPLWENLGGSADAARIFPTIVGKFFSEGGREIRRKGSGL